MHITALFGLNIANKKELVVTDKDRLHYLTLLLVTVRKFTNKVFTFHFHASSIISFLFSSCPSLSFTFDIAVSNMNYP